MPHFLQALVLSSAVFLQDLLCSVASRAVCTAAAGGDAAVVEGLRPLLDCMGTAHVLGGPGAGQSCKMANQAGACATIGVRPAATAPCAGMPAPNTIVCNAPTAAALCPPYRNVPKLL